MLTHSSCFSVPAPALLTTPRDWSESAQAFSLALRCPTSTTTAAFDYRVMLRIVVLWQRLFQPPFPATEVRSLVKAVLTAACTRIFCCARALSTFVKTRCSTLTSLVQLVYSWCPSPSSNLHGVRAFFSCPPRFYLCVVWQTLKELNFVAFARNPRLMWIHHQQLLSLGNLRENLLT